MGTVTDLADARTERSAHRHVVTPLDVTGIAGRHGFTGPVHVSAPAARTLRVADLEPLLDLAFWVAAGMRVADAATAPITSRYALVLDRSTPSEDVLTIALTREA